jgi:AGZA family xanthine/uracil permease-like MFS transporter
VEAMSTVTSPVKGGPQPPSSAADRIFRLHEHGTTVRTELLAGVTTFAVMSYIIFVNPAILGFVGVKGLQDKGLPFAAVLTSTCLVACVMSVIMGAYTNRAYCVAPGMGLNAVVAYGLVVAGGLTFPQAMGLVVLEGVAVVALVVTGIREQVVQAIPLPLKKAIAIGIGLFIAFIGLFNAGVVVSGSGTPVALGSFTTWPIAVTIFGLVVTIALRARRVPGDLLIGIVLATALATIINWRTDYTAFTTPGVARIPDSIYQSPDFSLVGDFDFGAFGQLGVTAAVVWVFSLFLSDFFDMMGTLVGVGKQAGYLDRQGNLPDMKKPLLVDALAAVAGGAASASSATTYIESGAGVAVGGRTGLTAISCGLLFLPFLFLAPLIGMVPAQATAPALVIVGWLMISSLTEAEEVAEAPDGRRLLAGIDFHDLAIGLPAALTIMLMPFTYSITNGIGFGFLAHVVVRLARGEWRRIHPFMYVAAAAFALYFLVPLLQAHGY